MAKTVNDIPAGSAAVLPAGGIPGAPPGSRKHKLILVTADTSYPTGGYPLAASDFGWVQMTSVRVINSSPAAGAGNLRWYWNRSTQKLQAIVVSTGAEVANTTDIHLDSCELEVAGY